MTEQEIGQLTGCVVSKIGTVLDGHLEGGALHLGVTLTVEHGEGEVAALLDGTGLDGETQHTRAFLMDDGQAAALNWQTEHIGVGLLDVRQATARGMHRCVGVFVSEPLVRQASLLLLSSDADESGELLVALVQPDVFNYMGLSLFDDGEGAEGCQALDGAGVGWDLGPRLSSRGQGEE